jgi:sugar lactone lactonase YvrE
MVFVPEALGKPDGMAIDAEGMLWIALWGGGAVTRWNPDSGALDRTVSIPAPQVTSCAFGGKKLDELYLTTARVRMTESELVWLPHLAALLLNRLTACRKSTMVTNTE